MTDLLRSTEVSSPAGTGISPVELPVLASTVFCMDILLQGPVLDLRSLKEVLTADPCAMLRIFRQSARLCQDGDEGPQGLEECIVLLGAHGLRLALASAPSTWPQQARLQSFAAHAVVIARAAQSLAASLSLCEETAFLVGAFHELGFLPALLQPGKGPITPGAARKEADRLGAAHHLPPAWLPAVLDVHDPEPSSPWVLLVEAAHELAEAADPVVMHP